jgi:hypothetical protein
VGPRASLDKEATGKIPLSLPWKKPRSPGRPARVAGSIYGKDESLFVQTTPSVGRKIWGVTIDVTNYLVAEREGSKAPIPKPYSTHS